MSYCNRCGALLSPDGSARWLLHHPEAADRRRLEWARRTAGVAEGVREDQN